MGLKKLLTNLEQGKLAYPNHNTPSTVGGFNYPEASSIFDSGMTFNQRSFSWGNDEIFNGDSGEPFIRDELLPDRFENFDQSTTLGGQKANNVRGGITTLNDRNRLDSKRIRNFMASPRGLQWKLTQVGLQLSNPKPSEPGIEAGVAGINSVANDGTYNLGINTEAQIAANPTLTGLHVKRGGLTPLSFEGYDDEPKIKYDLTNQAGDLTTHPNRMINLYGNHIQPAVPQGGENLPNDEPSWFESTFLGGKDFMTETALGRSLGNIIGKNENVVELYKYGGGPGSVYGIGTTTIKKYAPFVTDRFTDTAQELIPKFSSFGELDREIPNGHFKILKSKIRFQPNYPMILKGALDIEGLDASLDSNLYTERNVVLKTQTGMYRNLIASRAGLQYGREIKDFRQSVGELGSDYTKSPAISGIRGGGTRTYVGGDPGTMAPQYYLPNERSSKTRIKTDEGNNMAYSVYFPQSVNKINMMDIFESQGDFSNDDLRDFIPFRFEAINHDDPTKANTMVFSAYLDSYNDDFNASHNEFRYNGRAEPFYTYEGFNRSIGLSFKIAAQSRHELIPLYRKLNYLCAQTAPEYKGGRMRAPYVRMTVGDICYRVPGLMESVGLSWKTDYPWEIARLTGDQLSDSNKKNGRPLDDDVLMLPHVLDVNVSFKPLHNFTPQRSVNAPFILPHAGENRKVYGDRANRKAVPLGNDGKIDTQTALSHGYEESNELNDEAISLEPITLQKIPVSEPQFMDLPILESPTNDSTKNSNIIHQPNSSTFVHHQNRSEGAGGPMFVDLPASVTNPDTGNDQAVKSGVPGSSNFWANAAANAQALTEQQENQNIAEFNQQQSGQAYSEFPK